MPSLLDALDSPASELVASAELSRA
jgi:hypothetical protein